MGYHRDCIRGGEEHAMPDDKVTSLSEFIERVGELRKWWRVPEHKELWFRGESEKYKTFLRPELYRPRKDRDLKPVPKLLGIEMNFYEDFQRCALQLLNGGIPDEYYSQQFPESDKTQSLFLDSRVVACEDGVY